MPIVTPPFYEPSRTFQFRTPQGLLVSVDFDKRVTGIPGSDPALPMRCADNPLVLSMQTFDESYSPIVALSADLRFFWDADTSLGTFLSMSPHSSGYPFWRPTISVYDPEDNLIFQRVMRLSEQDFIEEITDREHVVTLKMSDGLAGLKGIQFKTNLDSWANCQTQDKNMTILDCIGWCLHQYKFFFGDLWLIDNLEHTGDTYDTTQPYLTQLYLNPETFSNAEGQTMDCYTVLENLLRDNYLELRPTNKHGWLLIRKADYCRLPVTARCWKITYNAGVSTTVDVTGEITDAELKFYEVVKDGDVGEGGRGHCSPVDHYMNQTIIAPLGAATTLTNYRNIFTTFPNEFMRDGDIISTVGGITVHDITCWTFSNINTTSGAITPVGTIYANRYVDKDAEGKDLFDMVHFHNVGAGSSMAVARCMVSAFLEIRKGMALKLAWQHTYSPEITSGNQMLLAILANTAGGTRWVQDDGSLGTAFNTITINGTDLSSKLKGNFALTGGTLEPYYEFTFTVLPLSDAYAGYTIYLVGQRNDYKMKDFRVESEYYYAGQDERRIEGQSSAVTRGGVIAPETLSDNITQFDSPFYDTAGSMYLPDIGGTHQLTSWQWRRHGYGSDEDAPKSFIHQYALGKMCDDRRFLRRLDAMFYGLYIPETDPAFSTILGFPPNDDIINYFRLFRFLDRPTPEDTRYYCLTSFSDYNLKLATTNILLTEVYCSTALQEIDPDTITTTEKFTILYNGDRTNINRASMESRDKQIQQGKGWWWLFGPLGWLVWGRKRKIG